MLTVQIHLELISINLINDYWRAVCGESRKHGSGGGGWKSTSNGNSLAVYLTVLTK